jgi:membrane associated rhomboid family serine protease
MTPWVRRLIAANVAVFALTNFFMPGLGNFLAFIPNYVLLMPWTPITYMFVHAGMSHIFFNMLGLFFFGPPVEARLGSRRFLWLYFVSGFSGAALSFVFSMVPIVGASAAVFGIMLAFARYWPREKMLIWGIFPIEARWMVLIMTALALFGTTGRFETGVAHYAHLGGFVGAWIYLTLADRFSPAAQFKARATPEARRVGLQDVQRWSSIRRDQMHPINRDELDRILAKLAQAGVGSLSLDERAFLDRFSS